ncbi:peptide chain release factor N(5)-glutamine methyltransferase [candidate division WOR-3 bacterium]|nr:peptide chain release factor N(5)-glutamine methyltransferase [candidate division WOR-3 bacterium]
MSRPATDVISTPNISDIDLDDRLFILEYLTGRSVADLIVDQTRLSLREIKKYNDLLELRRSGTPLQLIFGTSWFIDFEVSVSPGVFIPRPETEQLVEQTLEKTSAKPKIILEIGAGTGAVSIALARAFPEARVYSTDLSPAAVDLARKNAASLGIKDRIRFINADLFDFSDSKQLECRVDLLISNPPYLPTSRLNTLPPEVRNFDPVLALDGGEDGFLVLKALLDNTERFLSTNGFAAFEIDPVLKKPLKNYTRSSNLDFEYGVDNYRNLRFLFVRRK